MPLKWLVSATLLGICCYFSDVKSQTSSNLDTESIEWLISQIELGEIQQNQLLMTNSLEKLLSIAANNILAKCAQARVSLVQNNLDEAQTIINQFSNLDNLQPCVKQVKLLARVNSKDKQQIQQARLLARAGQYEAATKIYSKLFSSTYPSIEYEFEHINWFSNDINNWQQAFRGYQSIRSRYPNIGRFDIAYAKHILQRQPQDKDALSIYRHYAQSSQYSVETEFAWLAALNSMPINTKTDQAYQDYLNSYPNSSKGKLQYTDFKNALKLELMKQADPAYKLYKRGAIALEKQQWAHAEKLLLQAYKGRPDDHEVLNSLGLLYLRQGINDRAYIFFKKAQRSTQNIDLVAKYRGLAKTAKFWQYIDETKTALASQSFKKARLKIDLAETLAESQETVNYYRGELFRTQGNLAQALKLYYKVLESDPINTASLSAILEVLSADNNFERANTFYYQLSNAQQIAVSEQYLQIQSQQLRQRANDLSEQGQLDGAVNLLLLAIKQTPRQSWLYYDLANLYQQQGLLDHAKALYNKTLWQFPLDAELRYSHAVFLRSLNDYQGALNTLSYVPNNDRDENVIQLMQQLSINAKMNKLANNVAGNRATIIYNLTELEAQPLTPLMQAELATQWKQINEYNYAVRQLNGALERDPTLSPYWHMTYGQWLLEGNKEQLAKQWFVNYTLPQPATEEQQTSWVRLQADYINKFNQGEERLNLLNSLAQDNPNNTAVFDILINAYIQQSQPDIAIELFKQQYRQGSVLAPETELEVARVSRELGEDALSDRILTAMINDVGKEQTYQQQLLMSALTDFSDENNVIQLANQLLVKSGYSQEMYYQGALVAQSHKQNNVAENWYKEAIEPHSSIKTQHNPELNYQLYSLDETAPWYVNNAKRELARMQQHDQAYITAGINLSSQTSTQSDATLAAGSFPIEAGFSLWDGMAIIKLDPMSVSSQETRFDETFAGSRYGQGALCILDCPLNSITPKQEGIDIGLAWLNDTWRFDIGTTPIGFLVEDIVWGVDYNDSFGDFGYSVTLNKRPVTSSVLSYAGLEDVFTNQVWGGVRATSLRFNLSHDLGLDWGFWGSTDFQLLQGKNVKDNQRYSIMGGAYHRYIREKNTELTIGANLLHWSYQYNLSEETFGHGGYYSPQNYLGVSMPITYDRRVNNDFIYRLRAGLSWSTTRNDESEFFPNDPLLQNQAIVRESLTGVSPYFTEDSSSGIAYNLGGSFEYRFTPHWFFGGFFNLDRADFYEPNYAQLYFRYYFNPVYTEMIFPGTPVVPYADY